ncbi:MAG: OmpA family protein [Caulobacterales bacterium]
MSTDQTADPRKPQGNWPLICFVLGLLAVWLVSCQSQTSAVPPSTPKVVNTSAPAAPPPDPYAHLTADAKRIVLALGDAPTADACNAAFKEMMAGETVNFSTGATALADSAMPALDGAAAIAGKCKAYKIEIGGHTDRSGSRAINLRISDQRAAAVKDYIVGKGAPAAILTPKGYGESELLDKSTGAKAAARNRRISFAVTA